MPEGGRALVGTRNRALTFALRPPRVRRAVTYEEAWRWLAKIGGTWSERREPEPPRLRRTVVVSVRSAKGQMVERCATFGGVSEPWEHELEVRRAFVRACDELKRALS